MAIPPNRQPSPNPKYPFVGPNYIKYGETQGYIYNPYTDKFSPDPQAIKELGQANGTIPPDPKKPGVADIIVPIGVGAIALEGGRQIGKKIPGLLSSGDKVPGTSAPNTSGVTNPTPNTAPGNTGATTNVPNAPAAGPSGLMSANESIGSAPMSGANVVGQNMDGSPIYATNTSTLPQGSEVLEDGSIINSETGAVIGRAVQGALGAYQIYTGLKDFKDDKIGGALGIASGGAQVAQAAGYQTGNIAPGLLAAKGGYDVYNSLQNGGEGIRSATTELGAGLGSFAGPVGTVVGGVVGNTVGYGLQGDGFKNDLALAPVTGGLSIIPGVGDKIRSTLVHKTIKQRQQERWGELADEGITGAKEAFEVSQSLGDKSGMLLDGDGNVVLDEEGKPKKWNFADASKMALADPRLIPHWRDQYANFKTFGNDWKTYSPEQQDAMVTEFLKQGVYKSSKGDIMFTDEDKAKQIRDNVLKATGGAPAAPPPPASTNPVVDAGNTAGAQPLAPAPLNKPNPGITSANPPPAAPPAAPVQPVRSTTLSPGIGKDGKRISYGMIGIGR